MKGLLTAGFAGVCVILINGINIFRANANELMNCIKFIDHSMLCNELCLLSCELFATALASIVWVAIMELAIDKL